MPGVRQQRRAVLVHDAQGSTRELLIGRVLARSASSRARCAAARSTGFARRMAAATSRVGKRPQHDFQSGTHVSPGGAGHGGASAGVQTLFM